MSHKHCQAPGCFCDLPNEERRPKVGDEVWTGCMGRDGIGDPWDHLVVTSVTDDGFKLEDRYDKRLFADEGKKWRWTKPGGTP